MASRSSGMLGRVACLVFVTTFGCVSANPGYSDVQRLGAERLGVKPVWSHAEGAQGQRARKAQIEKWLAEPLTAGRAVHVAILSNPSLQASFEELGEARAALVQALRIPNPTASAALRYDGGKRPEIDLSGTLDLSGFLFIAAENGVADAQLGVATLSVVGAAITLGYEVRAAFYRYQAARQLAELRGTALSALEASFEVATRLRAAGNITELSLANEQGAYEEARLAAARAESELLVSREQLGSLMGLSDSHATWTVAPRLPNLPDSDEGLRDLERRALANSLDLRLVRARFDAAAKRANLSRWRGVLPELRAGVSAERQSEWAVGPLVELELPLFYQGQGQTGAALSAMRRQKSLYEALVGRLRASARATALRVAAARSSAASYRDTVLPLRARILEGSEAEYNAMSIGLFQLLEAKRAQIQAGSAWVEMLRAYWLSRLDAEELLAGRLPSSELSGGALSSEGANSEPSAARAAGH